MTSPRHRPVRPWHGLFVLLLVGCAADVGTPFGRTRVIDAYLDGLADEYPYASIANLDHPAARTRYRTAVTAADQAPVDFYRILAGMLAELDDLHVQLILPDDLDLGPVTSLHGLGGWEFVYAEKRVLVGTWPEGCEPVRPDDLSRQPHALPELLRVDGQRANVALMDHLFRGRPGTEAELELGWSNGRTTRHVVRRPAVHPPREPLENAILRPLEGDMFRLVEVPPLDGFAAALVVQDVGLLRLARFDITLDQIPAYREQLRSAFEQLAATRALVVDLRGNSGGLYDAAEAAVGHFFAGEALMGLLREDWFFGALVLTGTAEAPSRAPVYDGEVVLLVDGLTGSASELFVRTLQRSGRALVVGSRTAGAEAALASLQGPDGSTVKFGKRLLVDPKGSGFQERGLTPDRSVGLTWEGLERDGVATAVERSNRDQLRVALELIDAADVTAELLEELEQLRAHEGLLRFLRAPLTDSGTRPPDRRPERAASASVRRQAPSSGTC